MEILGGSRDWIIAGCILNDGPQVRNIVLGFKQQNGSERNSGFGVEAEIPKFFDLCRAQGH